MNVWPFSLKMAEAIKPSFSLYKNDAVRGLSLTDCWHLHVSRKSKRLAHIMSQLPKRNNVSMRESMKQMAVAQTVKNHIIIICVIARVPASPSRPSEQLSWFIGDPLRHKERHTSVWLCERWTVPFSALIPPFKVPWMRATSAISPHRGWMVMWPHRRRSDSSRGTFAACPDSRSLHNFCLCLHPTPSNKGERCP